jgi:NTE family protein
MQRFLPWVQRRGPGGMSLGGVELGDRPWLVLGGGGLKGLAHLGAWRVLHDAGFRPTGILGTSIGALVGAAVAGGREFDELEARARELTRARVAPISRRALWVNGVRAPALFLAAPLRETIRELLPEGGWEAYGQRFQVNAVELGSGREEWFGIGARTDVSPADAVYASAALPVFYPPARLPGGAYVDGGTAHALPVARAAALGATGIVAIDAGSGGPAKGPQVADGGMLAVHERVFSLMVARRRLEDVEQWEGPPLVYLRPELDGYGTFDFEHIDYFLKEGARAAKGVVEGEGADVARS